MLAAATVADVLGTRDRVRNALEAVHDKAWATCDPALLSLCERRIAKLLGTTPGEQVSLAAEAEVDEDLARLALIFVDQWVVDVASVTDQMVEDLRTHLGSGPNDEDALMDFVHGLLVVEQRLRLGLAWDRLGLSA